MAQNIPSICIPSICIPRAFANITEDRIASVFAELKFGGPIRSIDKVARVNAEGKKFNTFFIHFERWYQDEQNQVVRDRMLAGGEVKIIYDDPWFWKISASRFSLPKPKKINKSRPQLILENEPCCWIGNQNPSSTQEEEEEGEDDSD